MQTTIDRISIEELGQLYNIKQSAVYYRLGKLKIKPERTRDGSWINADQRQVMDALDIHIKNGGTIDNFIRQFSSQSIENSSQLQPIENFNGELAPFHQPTWLTFVEAIATRLSSAVPDPLVPQEQLQRICDRGWLVSTSQLMAILGIKSLQDGQERYGFIIQKSGKVGRELAWRVQKQ